MGKLVKAWHFVGDTLRDGRPVPSDGVWLVHEGGEPVLCERGLHASRRLIDALMYAPGGTICRVSVRRIVGEEDDKLVAWERRIDWRITDTDPLLRSFARKAALSVVHLWNAPDVVRRYLETGDESLRAAARAATRDAASDAPVAAAWAATWDAAAWNAARAAARAATWDAASDAPVAAAWAAKLAEFNTILEAMVTEHHEREAA